MKKTLLIMLAAVLILGQSLQAQDQANYIKDGNFEEQGVWEISTSDGVPTDMAWDFGTLANAPAGGDEACLKVSVSGINTSFNQILAQKVYLTVGDQYTFSGAFNDAGSDADIEGMWAQVIIWPAIEDDDLSDNLNAGPAGWDDYMTCILLNLVQGWGTEHLGIGENTTFEEYQIAHYGDAIGLSNGGNQGDTTNYEVPEVLHRATDDLELGEIGDSVEYYVMLSIGAAVYEPGINYAFTFDEFKLMGPSKVTGIRNNRNVSTDMEVYPNPASDVLNVNNSKGISSMNISNVMGQSVMNLQDIRKNQLSIDISELSTGMYILSVVDNSGVMQSSKILKK